MALNENEILDELLDFSEVIFEGFSPYSPQTVPPFEPASPVPANMSTYSPLSVRSMSSSDILAWFCLEARNHNIQFPTLNLDKFANITSAFFKTMTLHDFMSLTACYSDGLKLYNAKEDLFRHDKCYHQENSIICHRPPSISPSSSEPKRRVGRPRKPKKPVLKNSYGKLWEFLKILLHNRDTCPSLIKWDDYSEGRFKFVDTAKVAAMWGERKGLPKEGKKRMDFTKFSRALRHHYKPKTLVPVYGRRLVYKFGPNATGWQTDNPIL